MRLLPIAGESQGHMPLGRTPSGFRFRVHS